MAAEKTIVAYWLCPADPMRSHLARIIHDLAAQFDAPVFEPHVTLYVTDAAKEDPKAVLKQMSNRPNPWQLSVRGLDYSKEFTKTLFIQFESDAELERLSAELRYASAIQNDYELNLHLSLIYKNIDEKTKRKLADEIVFPFAEVGFDSIKAVVSPARVESKEDVEAWRIVAEKKVSR